MDLETRYELLEKIGSGSFATVYRARDRELGREVAIKQIHEQYLNEPDQLNRYWQEAQLLASLHHPNIVTIFDIHRERGWLILELMQANLAERLAGRQMDLKSVKTTLAHCLRALKYLHDRGIVHGDIKPGNMMLDHRKRVKIGDFGLARRVSDEEGSLLKGTTKYMAPEVVSDEFGEIGPPSDLYSLGFASYELMCGSDNFEQLFPGLSAFGRNKQVAWMMWHAAADRRLPDIPRVLQGVPEDVAHVVQRLTEKDQALRYRSADEALADLKVDQRIIRAAERSDEDEEALGAADPEEAARKKRLLLAGGAFAASLILCAVMLFLPSGGNSSAVVSAGDGNVGIVRDVDPASRTLELETLEEGKPRDLRLDGNHDIRLTNIQKYIKLEDLQPGDRIEWERSSGGALKITATRPTTSRGRIRSIDRDARHIVVAVEEGDTRESLSLRLPERAEILVNDQRTGLHAINEGDRVEVRHLSEAGDKMGRVVDRLSVAQLKEGRGFVVSVDPAERRLVVKLGKGRFDDQLALPVAEEARITADGQSIELQQIRPDDAVRFEYDTQFRRVEATHAKSLAGPIREIKSQERQLVLNTEDGVRTVELGPSAEVLLAQEPAGLSDLRLSDQVTVSYFQESEGNPQATAVVARRPAIPDRWAVLIGVEQTAEPTLPPIHHALSDAKLLRDALVTRYAVPEDRVLMLLDRPANEMLEKLREFAGRVGESEELIVYVVGHGFVGTDGRTYLAGPGFRSTRAAETGLPLGQLVEAINESAARQKLLLLDCAHTRLEQQPSAEVMVNTLPARADTTHIIASCSEGQRGLDYKEDRVGLFAHFLSVGYSGAADTDRDLKVTPEELYGWLRPMMAAVARGTAGEPQEPVLFEPR